MDDQATIFLLDDDPAALAALRDLVSVVFPAVEAYASAAEFLSAYHPTRLGCLVSAVAMAEMSGLELQERLAAAGGGLPIVFLSGRATVRMAVAAMQAGAVAFLEKPPQQQELWDSIRRALDLARRRCQRRARIQGVRQRFAGLTSGERMVLDRIVAGKLNKEIAAELGLSVRTIEDRRGRLMQKLQVESLAELVQSAMVQSACDNDSCLAVCGLSDAG
jgi:FixJ family two-component response regulator